MARYMTSNERKRILRNVSADSDINELWDVFKVEFKRNYDPDEEVKRFRIFKETVRLINENNEKRARSGTRKWGKWGITKFADKKNEEVPQGLIINDDYEHGRKNSKDRMRILNSDQRQRILNNASADSDINELWDVYKAEYNKDYDDPDEDDDHFWIFKKAAKYIFENNGEFNEYTDTVRRRGLIPRTSEGRQNALKNLSAFSDIETLWSMYKTEYRRNYDPDEDDERFRIFRRKAREIIDHNEKYDRGEVSFRRKIDQFTDQENGELPRGNYGLRIMDDDYEQYY